ncbi:MAG: hypothetical protein FJ012_00850 [Chloroflexi bacterium]|nr:hypothetical protein [Chloroflexota bacterium]
MSKRKIALMDFDQLIGRLRFNLESARSAIEHGDSREPEDREGLRDYVNKIEESIQKLELAKQLSQKGRLNGEDVGRAMSITCFGNIGYCCGLKKACVWRDACRQALGIDDDTYTEVKEAVIQDILERANRMDSGT